MSWNSTLVVAGEVDSAENVDVEDICKTLYRDITGFQDISVLNLLSQQSNQLKETVKTGVAGDQGIMYGYACENKYNFLPYGYWLANLLARRLDDYRKNTTLFLPDGKIQIILF